MHIRHPTTREKPPTRQERRWHATAAETTTNAKTDLQGSRRLSRAQHPIVTPDDLGGVCVYRCQIKKLCELGLLEKVAYGQYRLGPAAMIDASNPDILAA